VDDNLHTGTGPPFIGTVPGSQTKFSLILFFDELVKSQKCPRIVIPVKTGIQRF
jgi:hypothetical protein